MIASNWNVRRFGAAALLVAVFWPLTASAQQPDEEAFRRGLDARDKKNWRQAATEMRAASDKNPKESTQKIGSKLGIGGTEYLPHYFLGEALFYLDDCVGAVTQWEISEQQPAVRTKPQFVDFMKKGYAQCGTRGVLPPAEFKAQSAATKQAVDEALAQGERVSRTGNADAWGNDLREQYNRVSNDLTTARGKFSAGLRTRSAADFSDARAAAGRYVVALRNFENALTTRIESLSTLQRQAQGIEQVISDADSKDRAIDDVKATLTQELTTSRLKGRDALTRARNQLAAGQRTQNSTAVNEASQSAQQAAAIFDQVFGEATKIARGAFDRQLTDAVAAATEALTFLDSSFAKLSTLFHDKPATVTPEVQAQRDALEKRVTTIRRRVESARKTQDVGALNALTEAARMSVDIRTELDKLVATFGPVSLRDRGVPAALEDGARQFFAGDYQQALATLDPNALTDGPLQLQMHLFRAAAAYHLFVRSGEKDQTLKQRALDEIAACKRLNSQFAPDSRAFAPRFLAFYREATPATP